MPKSCVASTALRNLPMPKREPAPVAILAARIPLEVTWGEDGTAQNV